MKKNTKNLLRKITQWGVLVLIIAFFFKIFGNETFDPEAYCPFGGLQTYGTYMVQGSMACSMTATQIMMGVVLAVGIMLFSKLFCGYLCPLGTLSEYMGKLRSSLKIKEIVIENGTITDKILRAVKYGLLFTIFYMTLSSSELFCKNFDPYYAFATGFKGELTVWMACISITICFLGNFFIKMFWCKYICPLGAASNIFKFAITFVAILGCFILLNLVGVAVSWKILLGLTCLVGYIYEIIYMESKVFPLVRVTRDSETCNNCGICAKKCPYSIPVNSLTVVKHIDCTACGECISSCNKGALAFNKCSKLRWVPAVLVVVLFVAGVLLGSTVELPTIDEKWGDPAKQETAEKLVVEGLRSVKCYGSSKAFSARLQKIPGIYGVATYVKHARVTIYYNPQETTPLAINEAIYVPSKFKINQPKQEDTLVKIVTIRTENMHDKMDPNYLGMQFRNSGRNYFGLETEYACPIIVRLYMGVNEPIDKEFIREMVEMKTLQMPVHGGGVKTMDVDYKLVDIEDQLDTISRKEFLVRQFTSVNKMFKKKVEQYAGEKTSVYELIHPSLDKPIVSRNVPYLVSYLSITDGVLGVETLVNEQEQYAIRILYVESVMNEDALWKTLNAEKWKVKMKDGKIEESEPKMNFPQQGQVLSTLN
ncbi:MAG: 4Fe-4S binding protein [Bacteroidales bacterium]